MIDLCIFSKTKYAGRDLIFFYRITSWKVVVIYEESVHQSTYNNDWENNDFRACPVLLLQAYAIEENNVKRADVKNTSFTFLDRWNFPKQPKFLTLL